MKKSILLVIASLALFTPVLLVGDAVFAQASEVQEGVNAVSSGNSPSLLSSMSTLVNLFLFLIGAVAVVMIIYGGFRYVTSAGESSAVSSAKNTILYAVVGLVIAIAAYAIVNFVEGIF